ncbi:MAG: alpha/beta fold hydrolase [Clostridium sp.]|nr:alpha/beta fold hydrolase [Clostridium sp.]
MRGKKVNKFTIGIIAILLFAAIFEVYLLFIRPALEKNMITVPLELLLTIIMIIFSLVGVISVITIIIMSKLNKNNKELKKSRKSIILGTFLILILSALQIFYTQKTTYTPPILNEYGDVVPTSVTDLEEVHSGDMKQWISMRGVDKTKPILLVLAGDLGESKLSSIRLNLKDLENEFVVVTAEMLGSGKSFYKLDKEDISFESYVSEYQKLVEYVRTRFNKEKIYMMGDSFGSILGMTLVQRYPQYFEGFVGADVFTSLKERSEYCYNKAMEKAEEAQDDKELRKLKAQGKPPYEVKDVYKKEKTYIDYLKEEIKNSPYVQEVEKSTIDYILVPEYGTLDKINYFRSGKTFDNLYKKFYNVNLNEMDKEFKVPIYFFQGRNDEINSASLVTNYFNSINAPNKNLVWFEDSGNEPWVTESNKFTKEVISKFIGR